MTGAGDDTMKIYSGPSSVYVFGDAYSMEEELFHWCSSGHNDLNLWHAGVEGQPHYGSWEFVFTVRADGEILSVEINFAKDAE